MTGVLPPHTPEFADRSVLAEGVAYVDMNDDHEVARVLLAGEIEFASVRAPEGCVDAERFLSTIAQHPDIKLFEWQDERCEPLFAG